MERTVSAVECGSYAGAQRHSRVGEPCCDDCKRARRDYMRRYRSTPTGKATAQTITVAQSRAETRLVAAHRAEYERYYAQELAVLRGTA